MELNQRPNIASAKAPVVMDEEVICPICHDMMSFPVTLPCGHNFDRGCLLTAWFRNANESDEEGSDDYSENIETNPQTKCQVCPLCRQCVPKLPVAEIRVNKLLQKFICAKNPDELQAVSSKDKETGRELSRSPGTEERRSFRPYWSFLYMYLASMADPPGFVLAILLLLGVLVITLSPQQLSINSGIMSALQAGAEATIALVASAVAEADELLGPLAHWARIIMIVL